MSYCESRDIDNREMPLNRGIFIFLNHLSTSFFASSAFAPLITRYCPSLSNPPLMTKPSKTVLCGQSSLTVSKVLPSPYPACVLNGTTVFPPGRHEKIPRHKRADIREGLRWKREVLLPVDQQLRTLGVV